MSFFYSGTFSLIAGIILHKGLKMKRLRSSFPTFETEFVLFLPVLENSVLPMG